MDLEGTQVPSLLGSSLTCLGPTGCSQAPTLRGVPAGRDESCHLVGWDGFSPWSGWAEAF